MLNELRECLGEFYEIERELGAGGMAVVYLARDLKHDRRVAIKVLRAELAETLGAVRFLREVSIAANLTHPNILPLHDSGQCGNLLYYVMPFVEGESLRDRLRRMKSLPQQEATRLIQQIADALAYAHAQGIVHRDIKPENIMIAGRNAVVTDFGIAKAVSEASGKGGNTSTLTSVGVAIGTPAYMAPEQALGNPDVDHRVDIYALGVMAYEMLTGDQPFTGSTPQQVLAAQITKKPPKMASASTVTSPPLARLIDKCLEKDPANRWQSTNELIASLDAAAPSHTRTAVTRLVPWGLGAVGVAAMAFILTSLPNGGGSSTDEFPATAVAVLPFANLSTSQDDAFISDGLSDELITALSRVTGLQVVGRTSAAFFRDKKDDLQLIRDRLSVGTILDGSVRRSQDRIRVSAQLVNANTGFERWANTYDRTLDDIFLVQEELARAIADALEIELSSDLTTLVERGTENVEAYDAYLRGRFHWNKRTADDLRIAAQHFERAIELDSEFAPAWSGLADSYVLFPPYGVDDITWRDAVDRAEGAARNAVRADEQSSHAHASLGIVLDAQWQWEEAEAAFERAIALDPRYATARQWYAVYLIGMNRVTEALEQIQQAEALEPLSPIIGNWLALALDLAGRSEEATTQFEKLADLHPDVDFIRRDAWLHYMRAENFERGLPHLRAYLSQIAFPNAEPLTQRISTTAIRSEGLRELAMELRADFKMSSDLRVMLGDTTAVLDDLEGRLDAPEQLRDSAGAVRAYLRDPGIITADRFRALQQGMGVPPSS